MFRAVLVLPTIHERPPALSQKIEVTCPHCGSRQMEPASGFSTCCRKCGGYFRIAQQAAPAGTGLRSRFKDRSKRPNPPAQRPPSLPLQIAGFGEGAEELMAQSTPASAKTSSEKLAQRVVNCFDCQHVHKVARLSSSSLCPNCGCYIDLRNITIKERTTQRIRTRGDVVVEKKGALLGTSITCGNLTVHGTIAGSISASGEVTFHGSGKVLGEVRCSRLMVEKKVAVQFLQPVTCDSAEILGEVAGNFHVAALLVIGKRGGLTGSVEAKSLRLEAGGSLVGSVRVLPRPLAPWRARMPHPTDSGEEAGGVTLPGPFTLWLPPLLAP